MSHLKINQLCAERSIALFALAELSGVHLHTIERLANGTAQYVRFVELDALASALGVKSSELVEESNGTNTR